MCLFPKLIDNPKYKANKKNGGNIPAISDERVLLVPIGCGKCIECRKQTARQWQARLTEEIRVNPHGHFVTLSFSNQSYTKIADAIAEHNYQGYELDNEIATYATRHFLELWRKHNKKSVRHWLVTELGQNNTERVHIHGIIFHHDKQEIVQRWKYGNVFIGTYVNEKTINYITKYVTKVDLIHPNYKSKILCSKGIGANYINTHASKLNRFKATETDERYYTRQRTPINLPIYYRNKIYSEKEREQLWLQKLDKQERYVLGIKIDISKGEEEYYKALEHAQQQNKQLGYGDNNENWEQKYYEFQRRIFKQKQIIKNNNKNNQANHKKCASGGVK